MNRTWRVAVTFIVGSSVAACVSELDTSSTQAGGAACRDPYTAGTRADDGAICGFTLFTTPMGEILTIHLRCDAGDLCLGEANGGGICCSDVACGELYSAWGGAGGPLCGSRNFPSPIFGETLVIESSCLPGDLCQNRSAAGDSTCLVVQSHSLTPGTPVSPFYHPYLPFPVGPQCGFRNFTTAQGNIITQNFFCEDGDTCNFNGLFGLCEAAASSPICPGGGGGGPPPPPPPPPVNQPPVARCRDVTVTADQSCEGCASVDNGSFDPDSFSVTVTESPACGFALGETLVSLTVTDAEGASANCQGRVTVEDTSPPAVTADDATAECAGPGGTAVALSASASDACDPNPSLTSDAPALFPLGSTLVNWTATDFSGNNASTQATVTVGDTLPPVVTVGPPVELWPPNHKVVRVSLADCGVTVVDQCVGPIALADAMARIECVTSDEPEDVGGGGDGHTTGDITFVDDTTVGLRVERQGGGDGRAYEVHFTVQDGNGGTGSGVCRFDVPHSKSPNQSTVDSGDAYTVCR